MSYEKKDGIQESSGAISMRTTHLTLAAFVLAATGCADRDGHILTETAQPGAPFDGVFEYMVEGLSLIHI